MKNESPLALSPAASCIRFAAGNVDSENESSGSERNRSRRAAVLQWSGMDDTLRATAMKRIHQFIACLLAVCVAGAGAVGLNPFLHRLVEHGGHGADHVHIIRPHYALHEAHAHVHGDGQIHSHAPPKPGSDSTFTHSHRP